MLQPHLTQSPPSIDAVIRRAACDVLAQREHSQQELAEKLLRKFKKRRDLSISAEKISAVVAVIAAEGLQSNTRYIEMLIRSRVNQGCGPLRITQELKQKGITQADFEKLLDSRSEEWLERAKQTKQKKFGNERAIDQKAKGRQLRFLQYRGFTSAQIQYALA
jgi:regulatory protein